MKAFASTRRRDRRIVMAGNTLRHEFVGLHHYFQNITGEQREVRPYTPANHVSFFRMLAPPAVDLLMGIKLTNETCEIKN
mgnify:FL=1